MAAPQERFSQGHSALHRVDPRAKLLGAVLLSLVLAISKTPEVAALGLGLGLLLLTVARLPLRPVLTRLLVVNGFTAFLWIMLPLTYGGEPLAVLMGLKLSAAGCALAWRITLKTNAVLSMLIALVATTSVPALGRAMRWWKVPAKLCLVFLFTYRYLFVIHDEYTKLRRAASMRCFVPKTSLATYRTFGYLLGMTLVRSYNRAQRVARAMDLRCFQGAFHSLDAPRAATRDIWSGLALCLAAVTLFLLDV